MKQLMKQLAISAILLSLHSISMAAECPKALELQTKDIAQFSITSLQPQDAKATALDLKDSKVRAVRIFATWCPHCKTDIQNLSAMYEQLPNKKDFELVLIANNNRRETLETAKTWTEKYLDGLKIPKSQIRVVHTKTEVPQMKEMKTKSGQMMFPDIAGFPYGMIFDREGKARIVGHFDEGNANDAQYAILKDLLAKKCP